MKLSLFCFLAISLVSASSWAGQGLTPVAVQPLTEEERANLVEHAQDLRAEGANLSDQARQIDLEAMRKDLAAKEAELTNAASILSPEALQRRTDEVQASRIAVDSAESMQPRSELLNGLANAAEHVAKTGDTTLKSWDDLSEGKRIIETFKYSFKEFLKPGPLAIFAAGNAAWYGLRKQQTINQSVYNGVQGKLPGAVVQTGAYMPYAAAGAAGVALLVALKTDNSKLRDLAEALTVGIATNEAATMGLKALLHDCRPGPVCVAQNGAPSGHSSTMFVVATIIDRKLGHKWGFIAYAVATGVVLTRLANTDPQHVHALGQTLDGALQGVSLGLAASRGLERAKAMHPGEKRSLLSKLSYGNFKGGSYSCAPQVGLGVGGGCVINFGQ